MCLRVAVVDRVPHPILVGIDQMRPNEAAVTFPIVPSGRPPPSVSLLLVVAEFPGAEHAELDVATACVPEGDGSSRVSWEWLRHATRRDLDGVGVLAREPAEPALQRQLDRAPRCSLVSPNQHLENTGRGIRSRDTPEANDGHGVEWRDGGLGGREVLEVIEKIPPCKPASPRATLTRQLGGSGTSVLDPVSCPCQIFPSFHHKSIRCPTRAAVPRSGWSSRCRSRPLEMLEARSLAARSDWSRRSERPKVSSPAV